MNYGKEKLILKDVINRYNPQFVGNPGLQSFALQYPEVFNVERLVEITMAHISGAYDYVDAEHYDFSDGSECKTASVCPNPSSSENSYRLEISNVISQSGVAKTGAIRVVLYNPHTQRLHYYFIPPGFMHNIGVNIHPTTKKGRIFATWNSVKNSCNKLDRYEVDSFETLAKIKERVGLFEFKMYE